VRNGFTSDLQSDNAPMSVHGVLFDLLMGVMNSLDPWMAAAGDAKRGFRWRDAVTARMLAARRYAPYEDLVAEAAAEIGLPPSAPGELFDRWLRMEPWPDTAAVSRLSLPYGFVTNTSRALARIAAGRSGLEPRFTLSAEEAGWFKPEPAIYLAACRRLGLNPARVGFVAGSPYDAAGARGAGMRSWLVVRRPDHGSPEPSIPTPNSMHEVVVALAREGSAPESGGSLPRSRAD
jgi:2-haloacid dehalogenase